MSKNRNTSIAIDALLYGLAIGTVTGTMLVAPNAIQMLDKPLGKLFDNLDNRQKQREISKLRSYLKTQGLVSGDYDHGIILTKKAEKRIENYEFNSLMINKPESWDHCWRIVIFDIPEVHRDGRGMLTRKLQELGFQLLQQSVWIHPFESKKIIYVVAKHYGVAEWVTYFETSNIDNEEKLLERFKTALSKCV